MCKMFAAEELSLPGVVPAVLTEQMTDAYDLNGNIPMRFTMLVISDLMHSLSIEFNIKFESRIQRSIL